ncbi:hypothetical protein, partial [Desulfobulbus alkaliphilus]|uniref:hypothetical protein n=1 Tax=Desulfobulbus alkaliphilus TaxID=869814 RepID=UPI001965840F
NKIAGMARSYRFGGNVGAGHARDILFSGDFLPARYGWPPIATTGQDIRLAAIGCQEMDMVRSDNVFQHQ